MRLDYHLIIALAILFLVAPIANASIIVESDSGLLMEVGNVTYDVGGYFSLDNLSKTDYWLLMNEQNITIRTNESTNISINSFTSTSNEFSLSTNNSYNTTVNYDINHADKNASILLNTLNYVFSTPFTTAADIVFSYFFNDNVYITFRDQTTNSVVTENITVEFVGSAISYEYVISDGILDVNLIEDEYTVRYSSLNYPERTQYLLLDQDVNLTYYMINSTEGSNVTVNVYDQDGEAVENAIVKALKYNSTLNQYVLQESGITNSDGSVFFSLTLNDEYYKFIVIYDNETVLTTSPDYIRESTIDLTVILGAVIGIDYDRWQSLDHSLTYNDVTNNFRLTWNQLSDVMDTICLELWKKDGILNTMEDNSCSTSSSGTILLPVTPENGTMFTARAYYYIDDERFFITSESVSWSGSIDAGELGLFLQILMTGAIALLGFWSLSVMVILAPLSLIIGRVIGLTSWPYEAIIPLFIVGVFLSFILRRKGGFI